MCISFPGLKVSLRFFGFLAAILTVFSLSAAGQTTTNIQIGSTIQQPNVNRLGVNLSDETFWDSGQMTKNLVFSNPGFEGLKYRMVMKCGSVTANTCQDDNQYAAMAAGYWVGATYIIMSGASAGKTGTVVASTASSNCSGCGQVITFDQNINAAVGDYFEVQTALMPGNGDAGWGDSVSGGGTITTETTDLSPETPGKQALLLSASGAGQSAGITAGFDTWSGLSFIQLNGTFEVTFRAKGVGGNNTLYVGLRRLEAGLNAYLGQTVTLTNTWQDYTLTFTANENGSAVGPVQLQFVAQGSNVELDDVSLDQTNTSPSNPTVFRDDVVNALKELNPGTIRMMAAGAALGSDIPNQLQPTYARYREGWNSSGKQTVIPYGIHEFLQLCQTVGADPWITIPTATTQAEMTDFIQYLTGTGGDPWSTLRINRGQTAPWTSVFGKIHIELGNETWNGSFKGESMNYPGYPQWANTIFGAARQTAGFEASSFDLIIDGWASDTGYMTTMLSTSTQHDSVDIAPYLLFSANNEAQSTLFGALFAEPEVFESPGGEVYQDMLMAAATPSATSGSTNVNVYETNLGTMTGNITEAQLYQLAPSIGAGLATTDHMLQMMRLGVQYQNAFALPQYQFLRSDGNLVDLWGIVVDMGTTNRRRPQFLTQALANSVIGGNMLQTVQSGANPTWNQPLSSDGVQINGAHTLQSFAFQNQGTVSTILFNLSQTTALPVTFSGANAPSGEVQLTQITSANITDNNETSNVVQPTSQTLSGFNPATGLTLPPFSMTVLTSLSGAVQAPTFSVAAGSYASAQSVSIADATAGATIYYSTDGTVPTANSLVYSGPVSINNTETLQAIAIVPGSAPSGITSAAYVIGNAPAAAPVLSLASGTYNTAQTVTITDSTPGAVIYYTTGGAMPNASSTLYTGPITVSKTETIIAVAIAPNYPESSVTAATYTISATATATPTFSLAAGTYSTPQTVSIADTTTGATIYYTTNGSAPTTSSTLYTGPITVSNSETISAIATATNYTTSAVASATYTIGSSVAAPSFSVATGTYSSAQTVIISDSTPGSIIYYTTDGSTPTTSSSLYSGAITVNQTETLSAIATATNYNNSAVTTATYTIAGAAPAPVLSVAGGTYATTQYVQLSDALSTAAIYCTTNGTTPTSSSTLCTTGLAVTTSETVNAIAIAPGYAPSPVTKVTYTIAPYVATPVLSVPGGTYNTTQTVAISDSTPGATIYYTTNGTVPTTASTVYSGPITISACDYLQAIAVAPGYTQSFAATANYNLTAGTPTFSVAGGTYNVAQTVSILDATPGVTLFYTTNGTTPTTMSNVYQGPITVTGSETVQAIAARTGFVISGVGSATYVISATTTATPTFSLAPGTYTSAQTLTLSDATSGAKIYFTTDGSAPTTSSALYTGPITVSASETVQAIAAASGYANSAVGSAAYVISLPAAATPVFSVAAGTYTSTQSVAISDSTPGAIVYYTTNGATPTTSSALYSGAIQVSASETLRAVAVATGYSNSAVASAAYNINLPAATPVLSLAAGTYTSAQTVTISDATAGAIVYYTTNGTTPTTSSTLYSGAISIGSSETVEAIAVANGYSNSAVASAAYTITQPASAPVFSLAPGTYTSAQTLTLSDATAGAKIYYTTNGTTPTASSTLYSGSISVSNSETVEAIAVASGYSNSSVASAAYTINITVAAPTFSIAAGTYTSSQILTISDATAGVNIFYTTNGTTPTTSSTLYTGPIMVTATETIEAIAVLGDPVVSAVSSATFTIAPVAATPVFSVGSGTYTASQTVTLSDATPSAQIYYTVNGSTPTTASTKYTGPITVSASETVKAIAAGTSLTISAVASASYTITGTVAPPVFSIKAGRYPTAQTVSISDSTAGAKIYYTTNGATPTSSSSLYTGPITVDTTETLAAVAVLGDPVSSPVVTAAYTIAPLAATPTFSLAAGLYTTAQTLVINDATGGATIYYTTDGTTPTTASTKYTGAITISKSETVMAIASGASLTTSSVMKAEYTIGSVAALPTFSVKSGTYDSVQKVSLADASTGAVIYYTVNGATPTTSSTKYTGPITVSASETIKAMATGTNLAPSAVATSTYTIDLTAAKPTFSVAAGTYKTVQKVSLADASTGAVIYYTVNGTTPTTSSTKYTGPITVSVSETIKAIATGANLTPSAVATATYAIDLTAATPTFSVAGGTYMAAQQVTLSDASAGAVLYYTVNGTTPTTSSTKYTGPITVSETETIKVIATGTNLTPSAVATATYTIAPANGFIPNEFVLHGAAALTGTSLELTNGGLTETAVAWYAKEVKVATFSTDFTFQLPSSKADGFTFTLQNGHKGPWEMGGNAGGLGYQGIEKSIAIKFGLYDSATQAEVSQTGLLEGGANPSTQSIDMSASKINLHSGHVFHVNLTYNGTTLTETVMDTATGASFTHSFTVNIASELGNASAYAGFTASTGAFSSVQNILTWDYTNAISTTANVSLAAGK